MTYELEFDPRALKEWSKLGETVKKQFRKKLAGVLVNPRIESARLHNLPDCYKIKIQIPGLPFGLSGSGQRGNGSCHRYWEKREINRVSRC